MTAWLLILATSAGGSITLRPVDTFPSLSACMEAARANQRQEMAGGKQAATICQEVRR